MPAKPGAFLASERRRVLVSGSFADQRRHSTSIMGVICKKREN